MEHSEISWSTPNNEVKIILLGESGVGKSSLMYQFRKGTFREMGPTECVEYKIKNMKMYKKEVKVVMWDTSGKEKYRGVVNSYFRGADGYLLVYDVTAIPSFEKLPEWLSDIRHSNEDALVIIVGNKNENFYDKEVDDSAVKDYCRDEGLQFAEVSAKSGENVEMIFKYMIEKILLKNGFPLHDRPSYSKQKVEALQEPAEEMIKILPELISLATNRIISPENSVSLTTDQVQVEEQTKKELKKGCCSSIM